MTPETTPAIPRILISVIFSFRNIFDIRALQNGLVAVRGRTMYNGALDMAKK